MSFLYKQVRVNYDLAANTLEKQLNEFSKLGWELVTIDYVWTKFSDGSPHLHEGVKDLYLRKFKEDCDVLSVPD